MKLSNNQKRFGYVVVFLVVLYLLTKPTSSPSSGDGNWTVYGTTGCSWTRKQLDHMKSNNIPHAFVDCNKESCEGMSGFPTLKDPSGKITTGFKQVR
jgi:hypothetical protein